MAERGRSGGVVAQCRRVDGIKNKFDACDARWQPVFVLRAREGSQRPYANSWLVSVRYNQPRVTLVNVPNRPVPHPSPSRKSAPLSSKPHRKSDIIKAIYLLYL